MTLFELLRSEDPVQRELQRRREIAKAQPDDVRKVAAQLIKDRNTPDQVIKTH